MGLVFPDLATTLQIHRQLLLKFGGREGLRDLGLLTSALELPKSGFGDQEFYPSIFDKASVYAFHIAQAQAFVDGNKRTALTIALVFLSVNGFAIVQPSDLLFDAMIDIANHKMSREDLASLFQRLHARASCEDELSSK